MHLILYSLEHVIKASSNICLKKVVKSCCVSIQHKIYELLAYMCWGSPI
uniref:Uncharacterized protein n=1 Tax=Arundo donax TaxID=35708 RepID=A0A0A9CS33_ARUDO